MGTGWSRAKEQLRKEKKIERNLEGGGGKQSLGEGWGRDARESERRKREQEKEKEKERDRGQKKGGRQRKSARGSVTDSNDGSLGVVSELHPIREPSAECHNVLQRPTHLKNSMSECQQLVKHVSMPAASQLVSSTAFFNASHTCLLRH